MAKSYRPVDREQEFLLPPSMLDWLPAEHLVWFVLAAVDRLDTNAFHACARLGGVGRRGYDPQMLLTLWVYAMAHGESSSRRIEQLCETDVAFRVICAGDVPDHTVLARFRQQHQQAMTDLLTESLVLAAELGMLRLGVVALDGTKIGAAASKDANRTEAHLRRLAAGYLAGAAATDDAEDALFGGEARGDELPALVRDRSRRAERIEQALAVLAERRASANQAEQERACKVDAYQQAALAGTPPKGPMPHGVDRVAMAKARLERAETRSRQAHQKWQQRCADRTRRRPRGKGPVPVEQNSEVRKARAAYQAAQTAAQGAAHTAAEPTSTSGTNQPATLAEQPIANTTDPDSRLLKTRNGWVQGYNCQTVVSADAFILSARATQAPNDVGQFQPALTELAGLTTRLTDHTGRDDLSVGLILADAGYDSHHNLTTPGPDRLIPDATRRALAARAEAGPTASPAEQPNPRQAMNDRLTRADGRALYKRRAPIAETPNAWLKDRRGLRHFARRGLAAVHAELCFAAGVTNLLKLAAHGTTVSQLQAP